MGHGEVAVRGRPHAVLATQLHCSVSRFDQCFPRRGGLRAPSPSFLPSVSAKWPFLWRHSAGPDGCLDQSVRVPLLAWTSLWELPSGQQQWPGPEAEAPSPTHSSPEHLWDCSGVREKTVAPGWAASSPLRRPLPPPRRVRLPVPGLCVCLGLVLCPVPRGHRSVGAPGRLRSSVSWPWAAR